MTTLTNESSSEIFLKTDVRMNRWMTFICEGVQTFLKVLTSVVYLQKYKYKKNHKKKCKYETCHQIDINLYLCLYFIFIN